MHDLDFPLWNEVWTIVRNELENGPGCHDFLHTQRVIQNAGLIAEKEKPLELRAVYFGALLHDIARPEELASGGKRCHAALGEEKAKKILAEVGCQDTAFIHHVSDIVRTHRYRGNAVPATLEAQIVYDADKLDSLGAYGIARSFYFAGRIGARIHNTMDAALGSESYSREDSAYREYLVKLRHLPNRMLTSTGRALAQDRSVFMKNFFEELNRESFF